eukprot:11464294-Prorocentrum_lima.AAC.1
MTSSLVGSEMCIRDRAQKCCTGAGRKCFWGGSGGRPPHYEGRGSQPVSYTHLTLPTICSV